MNCSFSAKKLWSFVMCGDIEESGFWSNEEFEETVAKGLILQYENTRVKTDKKHSFQFHIPFGEAQSLLRKVGCYFSARDRIYYEDFGIQPEVDGIPDYAALSYSAPRKDGLAGEYGFSSVLRRISCSRNKQRLKLPKNWFCDRPYKYLYENIHFYPGSSGISVGRFYSALSEDGTAVPLYIKRVGWNGFREICCKDFGDYSLGEYMQWSERGAMTLFFWCDRVNMVNVVAEEAGAKARFGIYESQIKSLLYARQLPMTVTGRKKPILHWVKAHQRRLKEGIDIDVKRHLRGESEIVMNGTRFQIIYPRSVQNSPAQQKEAFQ